MCLQYFIISLHNNNKFNNNSNNNNNNNNKLMRNQINIVKANIKTMEVETRDDTKILKMTVYLSINF